MPDTIQLLFENKYNSQSWIDFTVKATDNNKIYPVNETKHDKHIRDIIQHDAYIFCKIVILQGIKQPDELQAKMIFN